MKTLDERIQIITQRSRVIAQKKKRRRKALVATVTPVCLCAVLACIWLVPQRSSETHNGADGADGAVGALGATESLFCTYNQVQIQSDEQSVTVTDTALAAQLYGCILQAEESQQENTPHTIPDIADKDMQGTTYICFFGADGATEQYLLSGKALTNKATGAVTYLSATQLYQLRNILREIAYEK